MNSRIEIVGEALSLEDARELAEAAVCGLHDHAYVVEDEKVLYYAPEDRDARAEYADALRKLKWD